MGHVVCMHGLKCNKRQQQENHRLSLPPTHLTDQNAKLWKGTVLIAVVLIAVVLKMFKWWTTYHMCMLKWSYYIYSEKNKISGYRISGYRPPSKSSLALWTSRRSITARWRLEFLPFERPEDRALVDAAWEASGFWRLILGGTMIGVSFGGGGHYERKGNGSDYWYIRIQDQHTFRLGCWKWIAAHGG